jgi:tetratricopeptide (TPR) repeat protein
VENESKEKGKMAGTDEIGKADGKESKKKSTSGFKKLDTENLLNELNIDSAIGAFTLNIDRTKQNQPDYKDYLGRGIARCLNSVEKGETYTGAIEDLSAAIAFDNTNVEALYYRAYAYYMSKFYDRAIADCKKAMKSTAEKDPLNELLNELLGNCYFALKKHEEAKNTYETTIKALLAAKKPVPPSLFDKYREVCEKMRDQD